MRRRRCADGNSYERADIEEWLAAHNTSPITNEVLAHMTLTPNTTLRKLITALKEEVE